MRALWKRLVAGAFGATAVLSLAEAFTVGGAINVKYTALGRENGALGAPTSDETDAPFGGRFNSFRNGFIYWRPDIGPFAVQGLIAQKWDQLGRVNFGYPITDETKTADGRGRFNHFRTVQAANKPEASIYWTPQTAAHAVVGLIRQQWISMGSEKSFLGYPVSDEVQDDTFRRTAFENGFIRWTAANGAQSIKTSLADAGHGGFAFIPVNGVRAVADVPGTNQSVEIYADPTAFAPSQLCAQFLDKSGLADTIRGKLIDQIKTKLPSGFGVHSQTNLQLAATCSARSELAVGQLSIRIVAPHNRLFVRVTTPNGFPGSADPNFVFFFDLTVTSSLRFPTDPHGSVVQGPVTAAGTNISRPETHSFTGNLLLAADDLARFLGGDGFINALRQSHVTSLSGVDTGAKALNAKLASLAGSAPPGTRIDVDQENGLVVLHATTAPPPPGPH